MNQKAYMPIREFSRLTGIRKENLRFYDQIGLLSPELRGENGYRYYNRRQLESAFLIADLRALGLGLEEIKHYAGRRSPERMLELFKEQEARINTEIERLRSIQELMRLRADMATQALSHGENALLLEEKEEEPIFLGPVLESEISEEDGLILSYDYADAQGIYLSYPYGTVIARQTLQSGAFSPVYRYYFKVEQNHNACKPAGTYAVSYGRCSIEQPEEIYTRLFAFIQEQGLQIEGDAYEEYPLDALCTPEEEQYVIRVAVQVTRRPC